MSETNRVKLKPGDIALKEQYAEAIIAAAGTPDQPPPLAAVLLREVLDAEPQNGQALWYVGLAEAAAGRPKVARDPPARRPWCTEHGGARCAYGPMTA